MPGSSVEGCLNIPGLFSLSGELSFSLFLFSGIFSLQNLAEFSLLCGEWTCSLRFRNAKPHFWIEKLQETGQCPWWHSQKRKTKLKTILFSAKKYQSERGRMDRYTFWKCWRQIFSKMEITTKIRRKWTLYFWIGTPWTKGVKIRRDAHPRFNFLQVCALSTGLETPFTLSDHPKCFSGKLRALHRNRNKHFLSNDSNVNWWK